MDDQLEFPAPKTPIDLSPVWVTGIPIPPSSNQQYTPWMNRKTGRMSFIPSKCLTEYKKLLNHCFHKHPTQFIQSMRKLNEWLNQGVYFEVKATFFFDQSRILTKANKPKKIDVQNREKALFDGIASMLNIDDSLFFKVSSEKKITHSGQEESVSVEIIPYLIDL